MRTFRTELSLSPASAAISLSDPVLALGSCFAEHIGGRLKAHKFRVGLNPFGTLFNPVAISRLLAPELALPEAGFVCLDERWLHLWAHSTLHAPTLAALREEINRVHREVQTALSQTRYLLLTWGTAWVYEDLETESIVASCHKQPSSRFRKRLLSVREVVEAGKKLLERLPETANLILSVSPVRHLRDSLPLNTVSKSVLRLAAHELSEQEDRITYFPAYELLLDDLRDYRFFQPDMLHPSEEAVQYIWEKFQAVWLTAEAQDFVRQWGNIRRKLAHRPFAPESAAHRQFLEKTYQELLSWQEQVDIHPELKMLQKQGFPTDEKP